LKNVDSVTKLLVVLSKTSLLGIESSSISFDLLKSIFWNLLSIIIGLAPSLFDSLLLCTGKKNEFWHSEFVEELDQALLCLVNVI